MVVTRVIAASAAIAAFTIVTVAPAAYADSSNNRDNNNNNGNASLKIDPSQRSYRGGDRIKLDARCDSNRADIAISAALDNVKEWVRTGRKDFNIEATARVRDDVKSGNFEVAFRCGNQKISVTINVDNGNRGGGGGNGGGNGGGTTTTNTTTSTTVDTSTTMVYPSGAPQTGGQGPSDTGSGLLLAELGGVVLVAGAGVGTAVARRRRLAVQRG